MLRHKDSAVDVGEYIAPWQWRLPVRQHATEHPHTLEEFAARDHLDPIDRDHFLYLQAISAALQGKWLDTWQQILAVGPFLGLKRRYKSVPIVVIASYEDAEAHSKEGERRYADVAISKVQRHYRV